MLRTTLQRMSIALPLVGACLLLAGCGGGTETSGNAVEMRDMEVVDGTVNDSMTDLDAVKADGLGAVNNAGSVSRANGAQPAEGGNSGDTETVASE
jgi:hypothetical protein